MIRKLSGISAAAGVLLALGLALGACSSDGGGGGIPANSVSINRTQGASRTIAVDQNITLTATVLPADSTDGVIWESSVPTMASVDGNGTVYGVAVGSTIITARAGTVTDVITVTVVPNLVPATGITIAQGAAETVAAGNTLALTAALTPAGSTDDVTWSSSDDTKATVTPGGIVTGVAAGSAVITATANQSVTAAITVTVTARIPATGVTITQEDATIAPGGTVTLTATKQPGNSTDELTWSSSNPAVATVTQGGVVTGLTAGSAVITAKAGDQTDTITITVSSPGGGVPGSLVINGIPSSNNGYWVAFRSSSGTPPAGGSFLVGAASIAANGTGTAVQIVNGSVTIPVRLLTVNQTTEALISNTAYTGNDQNITIVMIGLTSSSFYVADLWVEENEVYRFDVDFSNGGAVVDASGGGGGGSGGGDGPGGGGTLSPDIDSALYGTWKDTITGDMLTVTFTGTTVTWGGSIGTPINATTSVYQGIGYSFAWYAGGGSISYKYSYQGGTPATIQAGSYTVNGNQLTVILFGSTIPMTRQ
jgi:uncharacterized protein YjdB